MDRKISNRRGPSTPSMWLTNERRKRRGNRHVELAKKAGPHRVEVLIRYGQGYVPDLIAIAKYVVTITFSIAVSYAVEQPFMKMPDRMFGNRRPQPSLQTAARA